MAPTDTTFTTRDGRLWTAAFTDVTERAAFVELGLRLSDLARRRPEHLTAQFQRRLDRLLGLVWLSAIDQLTARGVAPEGFAPLLPAEYLPGAVVALLRAVAARYPNGRLARRMAKFPG